MARSLSDYRIKKSPHEIDSEDVGVSGPANAPFDPSRLRFNQQPNMPWGGERLVGGELSRGSLVSGAANPPPVKLPMPSAAAAKWYKERGGMAGGVPGVPWHEADGAAGGMAALTSMMGLSPGQKLAQAGADAIAQNPGMTGAVEQPQPLETSYGGPDRSRPDPTAARYVRDMQREFWLATQRGDKETARRINAAMREAHEKGVDVAAEPARTVPGRRGTIRMDGVTIDAGGLLTGEQEAAASRSVSDFNRRRESGVATAQEWAAAEEAELARQKQLADKAAEFETMQADTAMDELRARRAGAALTAAEAKNKLDVAQDPGVVGAQVGGAKVQAAGKDPAAVAEAIKAIGETVGGLQRGSGGRVEAPQRALASFVPAADGIITQIEEIAALDPAMGKKLADQFFRAMTPVSGEAAMEASGPTGIGRLYQWGMKANPILWATGLADAAGEAISGVDESRVVADRLNHIRARAAELAGRK